MRPILTLAVLLASCGAAAAQGVSPTYCPPHQWLDEIMGVPSMPSCAQPDFSDLTGTAAAGQMPGSFSGFANPSASVGTAAVTGQATTAMRSDAAPAINQAISPVWTGAHTFSGNVKLTTAGGYSGYLSSGYAQDGANLAGGAYWNGTNWIATSTSASLVSAAANGIFLQATTPGQTIGNPVTGGMVIRAQATAAGGFQFLGTPTSDNAAAGNVGEFISSFVGSGVAVALTTATPLTVTSISLTPGDWDVWAIASFAGGATTTVAYLTASVSTANNSLPNPPNRTTQTYNNATPFAVISDVEVLTGQLRASIAATTTYYFVAQASFGTSTCSAYGGIYARRRR